MSTTTKAPSIHALVADLIGAVNLVEMNHEAGNIEGAIRLLLQARDALVAAQNEEITDQMIDDFLCAAFEGGINYWCTGVKVVGKFPKGAEYASDCVSRGSTLILTEDCGEGDPPRKRELTREKMLYGIRTEAAREGVTIEALYENHDASTADCIVQLAVLGELVYG